MKKKRLLSRILAVVIIITMVAAVLSSCSGSGAPQAESEKKEEAVQEAETSTTETTAETTTEAPTEATTETVTEAEAEEPAQEEPLTFEEPWQYYVTEGEDGIRLDFEEVVLMLPASWKDKIIVDVTEYGVRIADKASSEKWQKEGYTGGTLCYLQKIRNGEEFQGPNFDILGSTDKGQYILIYPSDVQAYYMGGDDMSYMELYQELYSEVDYVARNSFLIER